MTTGVHPPAAANPDATDPFEVGDGVRLWFTRIGAVPDALAARYHALLAPDERVLQQRFLFEKDRRRYLVTRALVRDVLARCTGGRPEALRFEADAFGKPRLLDQDASRPALAFNLTHTDDLVMLAVTRGRRIGVDVERSDRAAPLEIAQRYFAPQETAAMRSLPVQAQPARFWQLWTLKESYVKAYGMGLSIPLDGFHFGFDAAAPGGVVLGFEPARWQDEPGRWWFRPFQPTAGHQAALCVEVGSGGHAPHVTATPIVPLSWPVGQVGVSPDESGLRPPSDFAGSPDD